ncbi:TlpA disulfide reductase family protein [uncultured Marinobacter sp.]|jgi:thiol-disulfide isomerase/thioredoxin|uniref:TlpA family protein disulfide reductase n=1 Tax=uncultured Marinobacter sp. TaxID=187379 RepID=UPI000C0B737C|nr:redoxin [Marinobacter sp.]MBI43743.1 redoxin [Oceanospirillales bacterium]|tara:strand:+ start:1302 stop:2117 length:816 start_codon:yes stop_codon:yes gene_type:complete
MSVSLGPLSLALGHLLVLLAFVLALLVGGLLGRRYRQPVAGQVADIAWGAILLARIGFVIAYWPHYRDQPWGVIDIRDGGFDVVWGLTGAAITTAYKLWRQPAVRRPLTLAAGAGLLFWSFTAGTVALIERQARGLPALSLPTLSEASVPLSGLAQGQPMVINLWATWCPPCVREMPVLAEAQQRYPEIRFVFVNQGEPPETIRRFLQDHGLRLEHVLLDTRGELARAVGSHGLPTTLFYNARGQQVASHMGALSQATLARGLERLRPATP